MPPRFAPTRTGCEIELTVRGPLSTGLFAVLDDGLSLTFDRYPGLGVSRIVPCNTHGPCTTRFGDADLITRRVRTAYCEKLNDMIDVIELLQGVPGRNAELRSIVRDVVRSELIPLVDSQRQMMKEITKIRIKQDDRCPSVFTVTKAAKSAGPQVLHAAAVLRGARQLASSARRRRLLRDSRAV